MSKCLKSTCNGLSNPGSYPLDPAPLQCLALAHAPCGWPCTLLLSLLADGGSCVVSGELVGSSAP